MLDLLQSHLAKYDKYVFTVLGNHDCWPRYEVMDEVEIFGAKCWKIRDNIYAVIPGEILYIEDRTFLCIGGADSTDKEWRLDYAKDTGTTIWWPEERITEEDILNAIKNLKKVDNKVDYICTHCEPTTFTQKFFMYPIKMDSEECLDRILGLVEYDNWFAGHIHEDCTLSMGFKSVTALGINKYVIV